jgi:hypothetical protein
MSHLRRSYKWYLPICYNNVSPSDFNSLLITAVLNIPTDFCTL